MDGAFFTHRKIFDSPIWKNIVDFRMFFLIYGNAVFSEGGVNVGGVHLGRGQWLRSTRNLIEDLAYVENRQVKKYSTSVINRCIKRLVDMKMICTKTTELGTVFTVLNYDKYQNLSNRSLHNVCSSVAVDMQLGCSKNDDVGTVITNNNPSYTNDSRVVTNDNLEHNLEHSGNTRGTLGEHSGNNNNKDNKEKKDKKEIDYIVEYLNEKCKTNFKPSTQATQKHINARLEEGYTMDDFKAVIDSKAKEWIGSENEKYLRPATLFAGKFEGYLQVANKSKSKQQASSTSYVDNLGWEEYERKQQADLDRWG